MSEQLNKIVELLFDMLGDDFFVIADTEQHILTVDVHTIVPITATVFDELVTVGNVDQVPNRGMTSISFENSPVLGFRKDPIHVITLTSGSVLCYHKA